jgi:hypothetical protein
LSVELIVQRKWQLKWMTGASTNHKPVKSGHINK